MQAAEKSVHIRVNLYARETLGLSGDAFSEQKNNNKAGNVS